MITVIAEWSERAAAGDPRCEAAGPALAAALHGRAMLAVRRWLTDPDTEVAVEMVGPEDAPALVQEDGRVVARLPFRWLRDLWAPGLTVLLGRFCLALVESGARRQRVLTVGTGLGDPEMVTVSVDTDR